MTITEAGNILKTMCTSAPSGEKVVMVHLFGIKYASELRNLSLPQVVAVAGINATYATEISKMRNLAKYVQVKH